MEAASNIGIESFGSEVLTGFDLSKIENGKILPGDSARLYVKFYPYEEIITRAILDDKGKIKEHKAEQVTRLKVHIINPGDKTEVDDYAQDYHKTMFYRQYKRYLDGNNAPEGTALSQCAFVPPGVVLELRTKGVHTLEQLADASESLCGLVPNGWALREHARAQRKANIENQRGAEVQTLKLQVAELLKQNEALMNALDVTGAEKRKEIAAPGTQDNPLMGSVEDLTQAQPVKAKGGKKKGVTVKTPLQN